MSPIRQSMSNYIKRFCPIHINDMCKLFGKKQAHIVEMLIPLLKKDDRFSFAGGILYYESRSEFISSWIIR